MVFVISVMLQQDEEKMQVGMSMIVVQDLQLACPSRYSRLGKWKDFLLKKFWYLLIFYIYFFPSWQLTRSWFAHRAMSTASIICYSIIWYLPGVSRNKWVLCARGMIKDTWPVDLAGDSSAPTKTNRIGRLILIRRQQVPSCCIRKNLISDQSQIVASLPETSVPLAIERIER